MSLSLRILAAPTTAAPRDDTPDASDSVERADQFVAVTGAESEQVSAPVMVVTAYSAFWLLAVAFVYFTYRRQCRLQAQIAELEKHLQDHRHDAKEISLS